jgi:hypothetical protein
MGCSIVGIIGSLLSNAGGEEEADVALISDKYFLFEDVRIPVNTLKWNEIVEMAKNSTDAMVPAGNYETLSGFFLGAGKDRVTTFVASKDRLLSEIHGLIECKYWVPERFFRELVDANVGNIDTCTTVHCDQYGKFCLNETWNNMFVDAFWTAELHGGNETNGRREIVAVNTFYRKLFAPLLRLTSAFLVVLASLVAIDWMISSRVSGLRANKLSESGIEGRRILRDEMMVIVGDRSLYLKRLDFVNDLRPGTLLFNSFAMKSQNEALYSGMCDSAATLHTFVGRLKGSNIVKDVTTSNVTSKAKVTTFSMCVEFSRP